MNQRVDKDSLPLDKPRRTPSHPTKSHIVKTRVDGKENIIRFGEQGAETAGKPKAGESERMKNKRASFKSRHAKNIAKGKSSPAYWANKVKWAEGGHVTGMAGGGGWGQMAAAGPVGGSAKAAADREKAKEVYGQAASSMRAAGVTGIGGRSVELDRDIFASDDKPSITPMPVSDNVAQPPQQMGFLGTLKSIPSDIANDLKMGYQAGMFRGRDKQLENLTNAGYNPAQIQDYFARTDATLARNAAEAAMQQDRGDTSPQNQYSELANSFAQEYNIVGRNRSQLMPLLENFLRSRGILQPTSYSDKIFETLSVPMQQGGSVNLEEMYQKYERGGKARGSLLEGFMAELERLRSLQRKQDSLEFRPEYIERGQPLARRYDRAPTRSDTDPQTAGVPTERSPTGVNPNFASALDNLIAAASEAGHDVTINSGYRSPERQAELFADAVQRYGSEAAARRWVAPPGRSRHNHGIAADLGYGSDEARDWVHANAEKYGLNFRMDWEPWHIEPLNMQRGGAVKGYETGGFKDIARSVLGQGLGLGWGDEGEAWLRSKLGDERYEDALAEIQASNRAYAENNPIGSIVGEVAGGLIPTAAAYLATPFTGGATAPAAAATTARMGMLAPRVAAQLPNWMRGAAVGAGEGAIAGAGTADQGESRAEGAAWGAAIGAPVGAAVARYAPDAIDAVQGALDRRAIRLAASQVPDDSAYEPLRQRLFDQGVTNYAVLPQGNVNLQPAISAEMLRGPDVQQLEAFLAQVRGTPGVSQDALEELSRRYEDLPAGSRISKADFEARIPPSQYNTIDLKNLAGHSEYDMDLYRDQAMDYLYENPEEPYENVLYSIGLDPNEDNLHLIAGLNEGAIDLEEMPQEFLTAFERAGWGDDIFGKLGDTTESARDELVDVIAQNIAEQDGTFDAGYRYADAQRLLTEGTRRALGDNYFEVGVTHPDMAGQNYWHYPNSLNPDDGMIGHIRGTYIPADATNATVRAPLADNGRFGGASIPVRPNSVVIEEIQSDAQKDAAQTGALRQVHGTLFKAAINDALKRGADTVYLPSAATIAVPRGGVQETARFAPIYDQQIVKEGLRPLSQIPGVEIKPVGVNGMLAYNEITFSPEAIETILRGRGQRTPGYAAGGAVRAYDPAAVEARIASIGKGYATGGAVRAYDPAAVDQLVKTIREGAHV